MEGQQEVNNNVKDKAGVGKEEEVLVLNRKEDEGSRRRRVLVVAGPEEWLCVARLPPDMEEDEFQELLADFGRVEESFLVRSRLTGQQVVGEQFRCVVSLCYND
jgi:hypothetical protein